MKSPRKTKNNNTMIINPKTIKEEKEKEQPKKEHLDAKNLEKEAQFQKLEEYVNESGLALAFNIIFAELISKQILPENFFTYTSMRLKQIGKEIEGLKTKEEIPVEKNEEEENKEEHKAEIKEENNEENEKKLFEAQDKNNENKEDDNENVLLTVQPEKKKVTQNK